MLKQSVYNKRNKLKQESKVLKMLSFDETLAFDEYMNIRKKQDKKYQRWLFYDNMIKYLNKKRS